MRIQALLPQAVIEGFDLRIVEAGLDAHAPVTIMHARVGNFLDAQTSTTASRATQRYGYTDVDIFSRAQARRWLVPTLHQARHQLPLAKRFRRFLAARPATSLCPATSRRPTSSACWSLPRVDVSGAAICQRDFQCPDFLKQGRTARGDAHTGGQTSSQIFSSSFNARVRHSQGIAHEPRCSASSILANL
jgi:hypothetical protein